jgi:methyl acetate hydrolase
MIDASSINRILREASEARRIPGVVALASDDKEMLYEGAFGKRDLAGGQQMTINSVFWIASMTKAVTSVAAMQLVEQGKLSLHDPIARILPDLAEPQVLEGFSADGSPKCRPANGKITLRHLLTHTSGFGYELWNADLLKYQEISGTPGIATGLDAALRMPLTFDPGTRWEYGIGLDLVGKAVEAAS